MKKNIVVLLCGLLLTSCGGKYNDYKKDQEYYKTSYSFEIHQNNDSILVSDSSEEWDFIYRINTEKYGFNENNRVYFTIIEEKIDDGIYNTFDEYKSKSIESNYNKSLFNNFMIINLKDITGTFYFYSLYDAYVENETLYFLVESKYNKIADQKETVYDFSVILEDKYLENVTKLKLLCPYGDIDKVMVY